MEVVVVGFFAVYIRDVWQREKGLGYIYMYGSAKKGLGIYHGSAKKGLGILYIMGARKRAWVHIYHGRLYATCTMYSIIFSFFCVHALSDPHCEGR